MSISISGPVSVTIAQYGEVKFILFGDQHQSFEGECNMPCANANYELRDLSKPNKFKRDVFQHGKFLKVLDPDAFVNEVLCYTADGIIARTIRLANAKNEYVDVYLESAMLGEEGNIPSNPTSSMALTLKSYWRCLYNRNTCPYKNARFHYVDIRLKTIPEKFFDFMRLYYEPKIFINGTDTLDDHLKFVYYDIVTKIFFDNDRFINSTLFQYYKLCIESDNFIKDTESFLADKFIVDNTYTESIIDLMVQRYQPWDINNPNSVRNSHNGYALNYVKGEIHRTIEQLPTKIRSMLSDPSLITKRDGKVMHRIRAQLYGLKVQGDGNRARSLRDFIYRKMSDIQINMPLTYLRNSNNARIRYIETHDREVLNAYGFFGGVPLLQIDSYMMDLYTLARMFRTYPIEHRTQNKSREEHILPKYIIENAGTAHVKIITEYLQEQGAQITTFPMDSKRCAIVPGDAFV